MKKWSTPSLIVPLICAVTLPAGGCKKKQPKQIERTSDEQPETEAPTLSMDAREVAPLDFARWHEPVDVEVAPKVKPYALPLEASSMKNLADVATKVALGPEAEKKLLQSGAVIYRYPFNPGEEYFTPVYEKLEEIEVPIFVTTDSLLHLYHVMFDATLRKIEEEKFYPIIWELLEALLEDQQALEKSTTGEVREASRRNVAFLSVALSLLAPVKAQICEEDPWECTDDVIPFYRKNSDFIPIHEPPASVENLVAAELELIDKHDSFEESPIFTYAEDYTQYIPRGHYTATERLKNYFKSFMWLGRMTMLLKGSTADGKVKGLVPEETARLHTMQAALMTSSLTGSQENMNRWERIYGVTAFYVGLSDDLGPYEYAESMKEVFGDSFKADALDAETTGKLKAKLASYTAPRINGGTGDCTIDPPFTAESANECLADTMGFRFMGQRFIPDSYMFQNLVFPQAGLFIGGSCDAVFSCGLVQMSPQRIMPRGLDVMVLLGSTRASKHLARMGDSSYEKYPDRMETLHAEFEAFTPDEWHRNLYWSWLDALKPLLADFEEGYPTFMRTEAWQDKQLVAVLGSWTELRHDTILYAKQSYTMLGGAAPTQPEEKPVVGYVEPVPEFYARLLALTRTTLKGLTELDAVDRSSRVRLEKLETILSRLLEISIQELEGKPLTKNDYAFIKKFGDSMDSVIGDVKDRTKRTTIVADVHTDGNSGMVLEEGVGYVHLVLVAYRVPDGRILVGAGPVFSYYEFKHAMSDRLTDESWRKLLGTEPPSLPVWSTIHTTGSSSLDLHM